MENKNYSFSVFNKFASNGIATALNEINQKSRLPIIICIGSDLVLGDSLGPLVGTFLKQKGVGAFIYGTLNSPITAKEVEHARIHLKEFHPSSHVIAIDAAVGDREDVGLVKVVNKGLKPGLGVQKNLGTIGDTSIIGVVSERSAKNYNLFNLTRLSLVYKMAEQIATGVADYLTLYKYSKENKSVI